MRQLVEQSGGGVRTLDPEVVHLTESARACPVALGGASRLACKPLERSGRVLPDHRLERKLPLTEAEAETELLGGPRKVGTGEE